MPYVHVLRHEACAEARIIQYNTNLMLFSGYKQESCPETPSYLIGRVDGFDGFISADFMSSLLMSSLRENGSLAAQLWSSPELRIPILLLWVAVFGGSLHAPCTTFFLLSVGASEHRVQPKSYQHAHPFQLSQVSLPTWLLILYPLGGRGG